MKAETYFTLAVPATDIAVASKLMSVLDPDIGGFKSFDSAQTSDDMAICSMPCSNAYAQAILQVMELPELDVELEDAYAKKFPEKIDPSKESVIGKKAGWLYGIMPLQEFLNLHTKKLVIADEVLDKGTLKLEYYIKPVEATDVKTKYTGTIIEKVKETNKDGTPVPAEEEPVIKG